jgi:spermidine/putrescine-binding protein
MRKLNFLIALAGVFLILGFVSMAAAQEKELTITLVGTVKYPSKPKKTDVELFFSTMPAKPYDVIAQISGSIVGEPKAILRARARKVGGDAVIISDLTTTIESEAAKLGIDQRTRPAEITPTYSPGYSYKVYTVKGQIIKYKD